MKTATSYFEKNHKKNLSQYLQSLVKTDKNLSEN